MNVLLAAGLSATEQEVLSILDNRGDHCRRCYHQQAVMAAVNEFDPEVVVLGPALPGDKNILADLVMPLRELGLRVIFLPGAADMDDARKWIEKLLPWGVYCYVFDVVTAAKIVDKIDHPGSLGSLPAEIRNTVDGSKIKPQVENAFNAVSETNHKEPRFGIGRILNRVKPDKLRRPAVKDINIGNAGAPDYPLSVYVVFGKHSREIAEYLSGEFKVTGYSENLNAITGRELNTRPDVILALGTAVNVENSNYVQVLYDSVDNLRKTCPNSVIKLIFNDQVRDDIVKYLLSAGNCEVHKINNLSVDVLPALIREDKGVKRVETQKVIPEHPVINPLVNVPDVPAVPEQKPVKPEQPEQAVKDTPNQPGQKPGLKPARSKPAGGRKFSLLERFKNARIVKEPAPKSHHRTNSLVYVSHSIITVWNPTGTNKSVTALNLAVTAAGRGFDVALVELDLACPMLDQWFKIPQTGVADCGHEVQGAGIMTLGENLMPDHISRLLCESWRVRYLAAGNKLGNIGTPDLTLENMEQVIRAVYQRDVKGKPAVTIIDAGTSFEWPATFAALKQATVLLVPLDGSPQEAELVEQQLTELNRVGVKPKTIEVLWDVPGMTKVKQVCESRLTVIVDTPGYLNAAASHKPYCLSNTGREVWEDVLSKIL